MIINLTSRWKLRGAATLDSPVSSAGPLTHIQGMVTRKGVDGRVYGTDQCIMVEQALRAWKLADFVVLGADLRKMDAEKIRELPGSRRGSAGGR